MTKLGVTQFDLNEVDNFSSNAITNITKNPESLTSGLI